ncbi:Mov34/MPN/PAD-1 family protein [Mesorhizobium sp. M0435]|uniref:Mov34/MPN/PAD-1 family protein n=1 Tax=Mesorhizobium sp. M0435 TaxID=2956944 RepID=UPI00333AB55C
MKTDAENWYGKETGGTFMGYWTSSGAAVVRAMIPAGPDASHERHRFQPDQDWQQAEIAKHYARSGRLDSYLGDWHTHPDAVSGQLSWKDRACLKTIIRTPAARNSTPILILMCGSPANWDLHPWVCRIQTRFVLFDVLLEEKAGIALYG